MADINVEEVLKKLTLTEKVELLSGMLCSLSRQTRLSRSLLTATFL